MKPEVTLKYLSYLRNKKANNEGFTLIELLVVVIIIGVLAAVALPNLLGQVGKARETEFKNAVGTVNRSQQNYHFEKGQFTDAESYMGVSIPLTTVSDGYTVDSFISVISADNANVNPEAFDDVSTKEAKALGIRNHGGSISFADGAYSQVSCRFVIPTDGPADVTVADIATDPGTPGCGSSTAIEPAN